jgi:anti-sigma factor RsiW
MDCDSVRDVLEAFDAGELPPREAGEIAAHLAACPACQLELEETRELVADFHHASESVRPFRQFEIPAAPERSVQPRRRLVILASAALVWAVALTAVVLWPSLAARLTFLPVGRELSSTPQASPGVGSGQTTESVALNDVPEAAAAAAISSFGVSSSMRAPLQANLTADLARLLPGSVDARDVTVQLVRLGPAVKVTARRVEVMATVNVSTQAQGQTTQSERVELLLTLVESAVGRWAVSRIDLLPAAD